MHLAGQGESGLASGVREAQRGYAMAALLVGLSVMSVLMGVALPQWSRLVQREKEEELIFRGQQYARAIGLFQRKFANTAPPTIDLLVEQRFLRRKYKDPITNSDFQLIYANQQAQQGVTSPTGAQRPGQTSTAAFGTPPGGASTGSGTPTQGPGGAAPVGAGGIVGVTSKSKDASIKIYNGRTKYNEWAFVYLQTAQRPGGGPVTGLPGQPGQGRPQIPFGMPGAGRLPDSQRGGPTSRPFGGSPRPGPVPPPES